MAIRQMHAWLPSAIAGVASGWFVLSQLSQRWMVAGEPTAILVPVLICMTICLACIADASIGILRARAVAPEKAPEPVENAAEPGEMPVSGARLAWYLGSLAAFAFLIEPIGFIGCVILILPMLLCFGEGLKILSSLVVTAITGLVVYVIFVRLLGVDLPTGSLFYDLW